MYGKNIECSKFSQAKFAFHPTFQYYLENHVYSFSQSFFYIKLYKISPDPTTVVIP